jgi:hypothetical protein
VQTLEAAGVVLESLYEQWDNVTISAEDFERVLKDYATFLDSRFGAAR